MIDIREQAALELGVGSRQPRRNQIRGACPHPRTRRRSEPGDSIDCYTYGRPTMSTYTEVQRVSLSHEGLLVHLILHIRHGVEPVDFYCLSWRTVLPSGSANRRFYNDVRHGTGIWTIPVSVALELLNRGESAGLLDTRYDDLQERHQGANNTVIDSRNLGQRDRRRELASILNVKRDPDWGVNPLFIIFEVPDGKWRKIMIVDAQKGVCTFRSTTKDPSYKPVVVDGMSPPWRLDNAMQDASCVMMKKFQSVLRAL